MQLYEHMFVFVTIPDLELRAAAKAAGEAWTGEVAMALDPDGHRQASGRRRTGQVNAAARYRGVRPGMVLGQAVDLCPELRPLRPDPVMAGRMWEGTLRSLEGIGAAVESSEIGQAWFDPDGLMHLHGGIAGILGKVFEALGNEALVGVGPTRLAATIHLASSAGEVEVVRPEDLREELDGLPLMSLKGRLGVDRRSEDGLLSSLRMLGFERLGEIRALGAGPMADRFGDPGTKAWEVASGREESLQPREPVEEVGVRVEIPDDGSPVGLSPALALLCARLSAKLEGIGGAARSIRLEAELRGGGSWSCNRSPKLPTSNPDLIRIPFEPALELIPGIPAGLGMVATSLTEAVAVQPALFEAAGDSRRRKLDEAVRQVTAVVGDAGLLRVVEANPGSRLPERRVMLVPRDGEGSRAAGIAGR